MIYKAGQAFPEQPQVSLFENYLSSIQYQLTSIQYPNDQIKVFSHSWEDVASSINESYNFGEELKKDNYFENEYSNLINGKTLNSNEKIFFINRLPCCFSSMQ